MHKKYYLFFAKYGDYSGEYFGKNIDCFPEKLDNYKNICISERRRNNKGEWL